MSVRQYAEAGGRDYITPEDVEAALVGPGADVTAIRIEVLGVLAGCFNLGVEDWCLCAYVAWRGHEEAKPPRFGVAAEAATWTCPSCGSFNVDLAPRVTARGVPPNCPSCALCP